MKSRSKLPQRQIRVDKITEVSEGRLKVPSKNMSMVRHDAKFLQESGQCG